MAKFLPTCVKALYTAITRIGNDLSYFLNGASISHLMCLRFLRQVSTCLVQYVQEPNTGNHKLSDSNVMHCRPFMGNVLQE